MKSFTSLAAIAASAAMLCGAASASAAIITATWTGTISDGFDETGVFVAANTDLTGYSFVARYTYDTNAGHRLTQPGSYDIILGGSYQGQPSVVSAAITINGHTETVGGDDYSVAEVYPAADSAVFQESQDHWSDVYSTTYNYIYNGEFHKVHAPTLDTVIPLTDVSSYSYGYGFFLTRVGNDFTKTAYFNMSPATLQVGAPEAAPEPATWALMLTGLGLAGAGLRARRKAVLAA